MIQHCYAKTVYIDETDLEIGW